MKRKLPKLSVAFIILTFCLFPIVRVEQIKYFADGKTEILFGPQEYGAENNLEAELVDFISQTQESLDISVQELDSKIIAVYFLN